MSSSGRGLSRIVIYAIPLIVIAEHQYQCHHEYIGHYCGACKICTDAIPSETK